MPASGPHSVMGSQAPICSSIWSISLGLAFFNSLPLPHLDGIHILAATFDCLASARAVLPAGRDFVSDTGQEGRLWILVRLGRSGSGRVAVRHRARVERVARTWTAVVGCLTVIATLIVELLSRL